MQLHIHPLVLDADDKQTVTVNSVEDQMPADRQGTMAP